MLDCERDGWLPLKSLYSPPWDSIIAEDQLPSKGLYFPASLLRNGATWLVVNCGMWAEVQWVTSRPWFSKLGMVFMILFFLPPLDPKVEGNPGSHMMKLVQSWSALVPEWLCEAPMLDFYTSEKQIFRMIKQFGIWVCGLLKLMISKNSGSQTLVHIRITWRLMQTQIVGFISRVSDSVALDWSPRMCIFHKLAEMLMLLTHHPKTIITWDNAIEHKEVMWGMFSKMVWEVRKLKQTLTGRLGGSVG